MGRGLPWSVLLHVIVLTLVVLHGNTVQRRVMEPPLMIRARLVTPQVLDQAAAETVAPAEPETAPPPAEPVPLPPKEVPKVQPERKPAPKPREKPVERKAEPKPEARTDTRSEPAADLQQGQAPSAPGGASIRGTDSDFPFAWYIATVESQIARNWHTKQFNFGPRAKVSCAVHFVIGRNGTIAQVSMVESSGVGVYDREALRAVQATRLPPLPPQYGGSTLGITFIFNQVQEM